MKMYRTLDLFAGIGGIRRGFELTGRFRTALAAEIDEKACETYQHLFGENPCADATGEEFKQRVIGTEYDVLLAGFPCQAFSIAGRKEGFKDKTRGTLFFDIADVLERSRPRAFLLENVEGLVRHGKGGTFKTILETLVLDLDYTVIGVKRSLIPDQLVYEPRSFIRNSRYFGVPQNRPRAYIMGFDRAAYGNRVDELARLELPQKRDGRPIYSDLSELLERGAEPHYYLSQGYVDTLKRHRARHEAKGHGFGYVVVNAPHIERPVSNAILATGGSGKERNLVYDPQDEMRSLAVKGKKTPLNSEGIRVMTPTEWARLQGFAGYAFVMNGCDLFSFPSSVSRGQQYKQLGNSVSIPVIEAMAEMMARCLDYLDERVPVR